jgi:hypothetical protein
MVLLIEGYVMKNNVIGKIDVKHIVMNVLECPVCKSTLALPVGNKEHSTSFRCSGCDSIYSAFWPAEEKRPVIKDGKFYISDKSTVKLETTHGSKSWWRTLFKW